MAIQSTIPRLEMPTCEDRAIWDICLSSFAFPTLTAADELGLFSLLSKTALPPEEIAQSLSLGVRGTETMLAVLAALDLLKQHNGKFHLTDLSRNYLLPNSPYYWGSALLMFRGMPSNHAGVIEALKKDKAIFYEGKVWENYELSPALAKVITRAMHSHSLPAAMGAARAGDFTGVTRLLDIGGGSGCFSIAFALRHPALRCTVMELPAVARIAAQYIADFGVEEQVDTAPVDMFKGDWPTGYDAVFFSNIFHDWDRSRCLTLAQRSFQILPAGGRIYLHETLLNDGKDGPRTAALFSMAMIVGTEGKQYSAAELSEILRESGFDEITVTPTYSYYSLVSARKPLTASR